MMKIDGVEIYLDGADDPPRSGGGNMTTAD
jgi:hypothetical protein